MAHHIAIPSFEGVSRGQQSFPSLLSTLRANFYLGKVEVGDRLPPVRELARHLRVSPTTALDLYKRLEEDGIVEGRQRSGTFLRGVGVGPEHGTDEALMFEAIAATARQLDGLGANPHDFVRRLLRYVGATPRDDFKFAVIGYVESFQTVERQIPLRARARLPLVWFSADPAREPAVRAELLRDRSIKCLLATFLHAQATTVLARELGLTSIILQLDAATARIIEPPTEGVRYIITRDAEFADGFRRLMASVYGAERASHTVVAALSEADRLDPIDREAETVYASPLCLKEVVGRYKKRKRVLVMPTALSQATIDDLLFQYTFG